MKLSDAILKGMERFPKQAFNKYYGPDGFSACAMGAAYYAIGSLSNLKALAVANAKSRFFSEYGLHVAEANDAGIPREDIAGMLKAIGE